MPSRSQGNPRAEKVFVYMTRDDSGKEFPRFVPPQKIVSPGQVVVWRNLTNKDLKLTLDPAVFETSTLAIASKKAGQARVKTGVENNGYPYRAEVGGARAVGASHPEVIVDG